MNTPLSELTDFAERITLHPLDAMLWQRLLALLNDQQSRIDALEAAAAEVASEARPNVNDDWEGRYGSWCEGLREGYTVGAAEAKEASAARIQELQSEIDSLLFHYDNLYRDYTQMQQRATLAEARLACAYDPSS